MTRPYFGNRTPFAFAHRGGALRWPENTLLAFKSAADLGYTHIETDLHATADGHFVCFHDATLDRTTNGTGPLRDRTLADLKSLDAAHQFERDGRHPYRGTGVCIPTLDEALELHSDLRFNLEIKPNDPELAARLWAIISHHGLHDRVLVASQHEEVVEAFRSLSKGTVATSAGYRGAMRFWLRVLSRTSRGAVFAFDALQIPPTYGDLRVVTPRGVTNRMELRVGSARAEDE